MKPLMIAALFFFAGVANSADTTPQSDRCLSRSNPWEDAADTLYFASFYNGNKMYEDAKLDRGWLSGYVAGVHDSLKIQRCFCSPDRVSVGQVSDVVIKYLADNPDKRHYQAHILVRDALSKAWPCSLIKN
jgi:Rap1a immunity proteins